MTPTDCTATSTRVSQCLAATALMGRSVRSSRDPRKMGDRSAGTTEAAPSDPSAAHNRASRAINARLKEQQVMLPLQVIAAHTVGRLLARIPDTGDGVW